VVELISHLSIGLSDAAINCHFAVLNAHRVGFMSYDDGGDMHRFLDPGAGAITPYHDSKTEVFHDVPKGGELFKVRSVQVTCGRCLAFHSHHCRVC
jgi:hypothetical protein